MTKTSTSPDAMRALLIHLVHNHGPQATIGELLADPIVGEFVPSLTLAEIGDGTPVIASPTGRNRPPAPAKKAGRGRSKKALNPEDGAQYEDSILAFISDAESPVSANDVIAKVGGTPVQFRAAAERLRASKKIKREGKARGTKYRAA